MLKSAKRGLIGDVAADRVAAETAAVGNVIAVLDAAAVAESAAAAAAASRQKRSWTSQSLKDERAVPALERHSCLTANSGRPASEVGFATRRGRVSTS